jgi:hypothetical protein
VGEAAVDADAIRVTDGEQPLARTLDVVHGDTGLA